MSDLQNPSWFDPRGVVNGQKMDFPPLGWLVAQVYFRTNRYRLDGDDEKVLDMLSREYSQSPAMLGPSTKQFWFVGRADHRGKASYNHELGKVRAREVQKYFDGRFGSYNSVKSKAKSEGEDAATNTRDVNVLAGDRRVDCFAPFTIKKPIVLKPIVIKAKPPYVGKLVWREVNPKAPSTSIAGKTTTPPKGRGAAAADAIGFLQSTFDVMMVNRAIKNAFNKKKKEAIGHLRGHKTGGILAVAHVIVRFDPKNAVGVRGRGKPIKNFGPVARRLAGLSIGSGVYARPEHAISVWKTARRRGRHAEEVPNPNCEYSEHRFFWGTWAKP